MPEYDPTDVVGVLRPHLMEIYAALDWSNGHFTALDLADQYRQGKSNVRPSRAAALTARAKERLAGYLDLTVEDEDEFLPES